MIPIISLGSCLWDGPDHGEQIQIAVSRLKMIRHASVEDIYQVGMRLERNCLVGRFCNLETPADTERLSACRGLGLRLLSAALC